MVDKNPHAPAYALTYADVVPELRVVTHTPGNAAKPPDYLTFMSTPRPRPWPNGPGFAVAVLARRGDQTKWVFLADLGIVAYPKGPWSRTYTIRAS